MPNGLDGWTILTTERHALINYKFSEKIIFANFSQHFLVGHINNIQFSLYGIICGFLDQFQMDS